MCLRIPCLGCIQLCLILYHTRVGWQVGEEYQWQTALEETSTTTELQCLVTKYIIYETDTRRNSQRAVWPLTRVDVTTIIVEIEDGIVSHQVRIVEEQTIQTKTISQLELRSHLPFILSVDTSLVILYAGSRIVVATITISQTYNLWDTTIQEVVEALVTIVTSTITLISIVSHLVLIVETGDDLVLTEIVSYIVLNIPYSIVYGIVPGKQLITQSHIVVGTISISCSINTLLSTIKDIDEWELRRICVTSIIQLRVCEQELVRQIICETAVQVNSPRVDEVVIGIHTVGK